MADGVGVKDTPSDRPGGQPTPAEKKKRLLLYGGIGVGALLLFSHRGSQSSGATDTAAQQDAAALAAEQAAMLNPAQVPGGYAPSDTGGGGGVTGDTGTAPLPATTAPGPLVYINVPSAAGTPATKHRTKHHNDRSHEKGTHEHKHPPHPKQGSHPKPKPARSKGKNAGRHPETKHRTEHGHAKHSPATVESEFGAGSGTVVMGRRFPGAIAHRLGPPKRQTDGTVARTVTVDYGGHTETHLVHNNGDRWTDRAPGMNPPSRGVPVNNGRVPV